MVNIFKIITSSVSALGRFVVRKELKRYAVLIERFSKEGNIERVEKLIKAAICTKPDSSVFDYYRVFIEKLAEIAVEHNAFFIGETLKKHIDTPLFSLYTKKLEKIMAGNINNSDTNNRC